MSAYQIVVLTVFFFACVLSGFLVATKHPLGGTLVFLIAAAWTLEAVGGGH